MIISNATSVGFRRFESLLKKVLKNAVSVEIDDGLGAFCGLEEGYFLAVIHKKVLGQDCRAADSGHTR